MGNLTDALGNVGRKRTDKGPRVLSDVDLRGLEILTWPANVDNDVSYYRVIIYHTDLLQPDNSLKK